MSKELSMSEYSAVRGGGAGLLDLASRGRILVSGSEAVMFLNGLVTNDMKTLAAASWMPAAFANVQGRLLASVRVIHYDDEFLIDTEEVTHESVFKTLGRFTLAGDFRVADVTNEMALISVQGRSAADIIRTVISDEALVEGHKVVRAKLRNNQDVRIIRATHTAEDGFDLFVDSVDAAELRGSLINAGAQGVSSETLETLRIEAGIPRYGIDMDETNVVTETNLDDAVSFAKGCYLGQEIIVRIKHRGHVAKKLTGIVFEQPATVEHGARIFSTDEKEIGRITSSTFSPRLDRTIALGYVKYDYLAPGTIVKAASGSGEIGATVVKLPFVPGSWYERNA